MPDWSTAPPQVQAEPHETALNAYMRILGDIPKIRGDVSRLIAQHTLHPRYLGMCDQEIEDIGNSEIGPRAPTSYRRRRGELYACGLIRDSGIVRRPITRPTCNEQIVWAMLTPEEINDEVKRAGVADVTELIAARVGNHQAKKPTPDQIVRTWRSNEFMGDEAAALAVLDLFERTRRRGNG